MYHFWDITDSGANQHPSTKSSLISIDDNSEDDSEDDSDFDEEDKDKDQLMACLEVLQKLEDIDGVSFAKAVILLKEDPLWRDGVYGIIS
ncbi:hypothetical protein VNO77_18985 [Canavalia gladiata]|uniref:Uncharacterized protein n=1 Tax=Canavalia gladiata TaxID=3824 RepID=A0AAN9LRR0_CANGL